MEELRKDVVVLLGAGQIGMAIIRRVGYGKHVVVADLNLTQANEAAKTLYNAGFEVSSMQADLGSRESIQELVKHATSFGNVTGLICGAGVSPSQAPVAQISLAWMICKKNFVIPIPGSRSIDNMISNFKAGNVVLNEEEIKQIDDLLDTINVPVFGGHSGK